jgi:hypothetical protein
MGAPVVGGCSVVTAGHKAVLWWRHGHAETGTGNVVDGVRQTKVLIARFRREVIVKRVEVVVLALKVVILVIAQRLAVSAGLMCATMSN